ncbi:MAG: polymorphic toxin-type HINT domain-containing protein [Candidatus Nanoarchaeia archaeon]|nr:polymorphic toxin-type HINT domain-containing protein [Candidatus Nanoarchaeia archaeon]
MVNLIIFSEAPLVFSQELKVTSEHPFLVHGNWIPAKELSVGDKLKTISGEEAIIKRIIKIVPLDSVKVYNLEAGVYHNFVVGDDLIVHNSNSPQSYANIPIRPLEEVGGYNPEQRLDYAKQVLGEDFVNAQSKIPGKTNGDIIMESHNAVDLQKKYDILMDGLSKQEGDLISSKEKIKELFDRNICGGEGVPLDDSGFKRLTAERDRERYRQIRDTISATDTSIRPRKAIGGVHRDEDFIEAAEFFRENPALYNNPNNKACLLQMLDVQDINMLVDRTGAQTVLRDSEGNLLQGSFFALVLTDGHAYISRNLNSLLKLYPFQVTNKGITQPLCIDSLVTIIFKDGIPRPYVDGMDGPILTAKDTFSYPSEFKKSFAILLDAIFN